MANNGSVRGFQRRRYSILVPTKGGSLGWKHPSENRRVNAVAKLNKAAINAAKAARHAATRILGKVGLAWERQELTALTGGRLLAYMEAAKLTKPHGFVPGQATTYKHLSATKGYNFAPV